MNCICSELQSEVSQVHKELNETREENEQLQEELRQREEEVADLRLNLQQKDSDLHSQQQRFTFLSLLFSGQDREPRFTFFAFTSQKLGQMVFEHILFFLFLALCRPSKIVREVQEFF